MKKILFLSIILIIVSCSLNNKQVRYTKFKDLPQPVCDTLLSLHNLPYPDYHKQYPSGINLIDLSGGYSIEYKFWHSWLMKTTISNSSKKYVTDDHLATPVIVYNDILYIPTEYNIITIGFDEETGFEIVEL